MYLMLNCFSGKPPVLRDFPMFRQSFYQRAEKGHCVDYSKPGRDSFLIKPG
jgi:hypothetical protein